MHRKFCSRREWLGGASLALLAAQLPAATESTLDFIHMSDTHVIHGPGIDPRLVAMRKMFAHTIKTLPEQLAAFDQQRLADFVMITGDLIDVYSFLGADGGVVEGQVEAFGRIVQGSPIPVYAALGNHDVQHYGVYNERLLADQSIVEKAKAAWIRNVPCFANGTYYDFSRVVGGTRWHFAMLNNGFYGHLPPNAPKRSAEYTFGRGQLDWLNAKLQAAPNDPFLLGIHIPPAGPMLEELKTILGPRKALTVMFTGHNHERNHVLDAKLEGGNLWNVATPGYCDNNDHWRRVRLHPDRIELFKTGKPAESEKTLPVRA
jgi:predicted MPP superfamily phosphohydrolase